MTSCFAVISHLVTSELSLDIDIFPSLLETASWLSQEPYDVITYLPLNQEHGRLVVLFSRGTIIQRQNHGTLGQLSTCDCRDTWMASQVLPAVLPLSPWLSRSWKVCRNCVTFSILWKKAPKFVAVTVNDLGQLSSIIDGINVDEQKYNDVLTTCMDKIKDLKAIADELEPGLQSTNQRVRQWTVFRAVRKDAAIKRFRDMLEETKSTLILALHFKNFSLR
jgi:hypothetical protein